MSTIQQKKDDIQNSLYLRNRCQMEFMWIQLNRAKKMALLRRDASSRFALRIRVMISILFFEIMRYLVFCLCLQPFITRFLQCKGMAGLSDTKHLFVIGKESFQAAFLNQDCGIPEKILYRLFGLLTFWPSIFSAHKKAK